MNINIYELIDELLQSKKMINVLLENLIPY